MRTGVATFFQKNKKDLRAMQDRAKNHCVNIRDCV